MTGRCLGKQSQDIQAMVRRGEEEGKVSAKASVGNSWAVEEVTFVFSNSPPRVYGVPRLRLRQMSPL